MWPRAGARRAQQARRSAWSQLLAPGFARCLRLDFARGSTARVRLKPVRMRVLPSPRGMVGGPGVAIRVAQVEGAASGAGQTVPAYLEVVLLGRGAVICEDEMVAAGSPPPPSLAVRVARAQARHLGSG